MNPRITCSEILHEIKTQTKLFDHKYLLIFDLDDTIFDTFYRRFFIYNNYLKEEFNLPDLSPLLHKNHYNFSLILENHIQFQENSSEIMTSYLKLFLSDSFLFLDKPFPGVKRFFKKLRDLRCEIVFLTARSEVAMRAATLNILKKNGFLAPAHNGKNLYMKKNPIISDRKFKILRVKTILDQFTHTNIMIFDNESENCSLFRQILPIDSKIIRFNSVQKWNVQFDGFILENWLL